jgi:hypothetical protein
MRPRTCRCGHDRGPHTHHRPGLDCSKCGCPWFLWKWNPFLVRVWALSWVPVTCHMCPPAGQGSTPCCGRTPFELPRHDLMTLEPARVTCSGAGLRLLS